jgi:hypothetical protein
MNMSNWSKYVLGIFALVGGFIGTIMIAPELNISRDAGALIGTLLGLIISLMVPNLWKSVFSSVNDNYKKALEDNQYLNFREFITHPALLPIVMGIIWFFCCLTFLTVFKIKPTEEQSLIAFLPVTFSFGLSGLIMLIRKEIATGNMFGYLVVKNNWAIFWGILNMILGWGGGIALSLSTIFNW